MRRSGIAGSYGGFIPSFLRSLILSSRRRQWHPTPVLLPGKSHGRRRLEGCTPWGRWPSDTTEWLHFHFSLSCIGEGNGNPLQCSCLENPRDGGTWWAAVYGIAQSRTRLKRLSSSSSSSLSILRLIAQSIPTHPKKWINYMFILFIYVFSPSCTSLPPSIPPL